MSIILIDGFDAYGDADDPNEAMRNAGYDHAGGGFSDATRTGKGYCVKLGYNSSPGSPVYISHMFYPSQTLVVGLAWKVDRISSLKQVFEFQFYDTIEKRIYRHVALYATGDGAITAAAFDEHNNAGAIATSGPNVVFPGVWHFIEFKVRIMENYGFVVARVDGVEHINEVGLSTKNPKGPEFSNRWKAANYQLEDASFNDTYVDDLYLLDTIGATFNDFMNDTGVLGLLPIADAGPNTASQFGDGDGHFTAVEAISPEADPSYLYSDATGTREMFTVGALPDSTTEVLAVKVIATAKKDAPGINQCKVQCSSGGELGEGDVESFGPRYATRSHTFDTAPDGTAWTKEKVESMLIGFELV